MCHGPSRLRQPKGPCTALCGLCYHGVEERFLVNNSKQGNLGVWEKESPIDTLVAADLPILPDTLRDEKNSTLNRVQHRLPFPQYIDLESLLDHSFAENHADELVVFEALQLWVRAMSPLPCTYCACASERDIAARFDTCHTLATAACPKAPS